jgi:tetratricopeptide (TPR) repeat protein
MDSEYLRDREEFLSRAYRNMEKGLLHEALALARERIARFPGDVDAWLLRAACFVMMGRLKEAETILRELNQIFPGWPQVRECLGDVLRKRGVKEEAMECYRSALDHDPHIRVRISEKIESVQAGKEEDDLSEQGGLSWDFQTVTLADMYIKQGHTEMAVSVLKNILKRDPENGEAREKLKFVDALRRKDGDAEVMGGLNRWLQKLRAGKHENG